IAGRTFFGAIAGQKINDYAKGFYNVITPTDALIPAGANSVPASNAQYFNLLFCKLGKLTAMTGAASGATASAGLFNIKGGTENALWSVTFFIISIFVGIIEIVAALVVFAQQAFLSVNANLVGVLGVFTLGFLGHEFTKAWGRPYITFLYTVFITALVLSLLNFFNLAFGRIEESIMIHGLNLNPTLAAIHGNGSIDPSFKKGALASGDTTASALWLTVAALIFFESIYLSLALFVGKIVASIVNGSLLSGGDMLAGGLLGLGISGGITSGLIKGISAGVTSAMKGKDSKNSVGKPNAKTDSATNTPEKPKSTTWPR
ncbi:MAG: hypothetical protein ACYDA1_00630, partial [Vulcanimicrobiaceae bacterium]